MDSRDDLQRRRALATAADQVPGMFFAGTLALLEREAGAERAAALRKGPGFPKRMVSFLKYPLVDFLDLADGVALELVKLKNVPYGEALHQVGMGMVTTFMEGPVGRTMISMLGGDAHRMLSAAASAYGVTFTFGKRKYARRGENEATFSYEGELLGPDVSRGIVKIGLELSCPALEVTTRVEKLVSTTEFTVLASWSPKPKG